ncbi:hypothetical protein T12_5830 [Trichinella patagoniensis]|uniref:Uncharacterized protein n=1 Tax=Trichinella patagoniensis TaxID=990121 RepID=A0A0V0ZBE2_9BILA|nr:hypothetical protein T12_5830 [Trichinella patagoniensis]
MQLTGVKIDLKCQECKQLSANYSISYVLYAAFFSSYQSSSLIAALNCDVEGRHFCAISACRFVRVGRIWVYDLQSSKVGEEGKKKEDQAIKAKSE